MAQGCCDGRGARRASSEPQTRSPAPKTGSKVQLASTRPSTRPGQVLAARVGGGAASSEASAAALVSLVDEGRRVVPIVYYANDGGLYEGAATTAALLP